VEEYGKAGQATDDNIIGRVRIACRITGKKRDAEYVILVDFPRQQIFREHATLFRYTYIARLVCTRDEIGHKPKTAESDCVIVTAVRTPVQFVSSQHLPCV
jgi:hypothetical protein